MKEDQIKGFVYDERGQLRINYEDISSINRIFEFLYNNARSFEEVKMITDILCCNLEDVAIKKAKQFDDSTNTYIYGIEVYDLREEIGG